MTKPGTFQGKITQKPVKSGGEWCKKVSIACMACGTRMERIACWGAVIDRNIQMRHGLLFIDMNCSYETYLAGRCNPNNWHAMSPFCHACREA